MSLDWKSNPPYSNAKQDDKLIKYHASCYCGLVQYVIYDELQVDSTYCHCHGCQKLQGAPYQWACIFPKTCLFFQSGLDSLKFYNSGENIQSHILPCKVSCKQCSSPLADEGRRMWLAFPQTFTEFRLSETVREKLKPSCHIFYGQRTILGDSFKNDGLPKFEGHKNKSKLISDE
ncbi:unnamed protein product [Rotaria sp. Silwood1]|nr:unnamed protein product [Rotaria sp. Silwood1]CAF3465873.1 unnamed protein product [Rotaria sp. Silwood1]CAF3521175.1 unnamed protein product [Rotaria sp. Silwood1]CAF4633277.1 unnamed protein product [Rotaria sp. Silwood1]